MATISEVADASDVATPPTRLSVDAVIFDLDGTLLDYEGLSHELLAAPLAKRGYALTWEAHASIVGTRPEHWSRALLELAGIPEDFLSPDAYVAEYDAILKTRYGEIAPIPGALALLEALVARGVPLALATSTPRAIFDEKMRSHPEILNAMSAVVTGDEVPRGKPAPDIFVKAAQRLGVDPARCLVFEDSPLGVEGAKRAGCLTAALPDARFPSNAARFDALRPTFVFGALADFDAAVLDFEKRGAFAWLEEPESRYDHAPTPGGTPLT